MNGEIQEEKNQENRFLGKTLTWQKLTELLPTQHLLQLFKHLTMGFSWDSSCEAASLTSLLLRDLSPHFTQDFFSTLHLKNTILLIYHLLHWFHNGRQQQCSSN